MDFQSLNLKISQMAVLNENEKQDIFIAIIYQRRKITLAKTFLYMLKFIGTTNSVNRHKILPLIAWITVVHINVQCTTRIHVE